LVAAQQLGRQCVGIEIDEQHHRTAAARLQEAQTLAA
jgi:DNA modification methylase